MTKQRPLSEKKYGISKYRFLEVKNHCLQYLEWKSELNSITGTVKAIQYGKEGTGSSPLGSATENLAIRRMELENKCKLIEQTAVETDPELYPYILEAVTTEYATYRYLSVSKKMPCGDQKFYRARRRFYWLMSKKI